MKKYALLGGVLVALSAAGIGLTARRGTQGTTWGSAGLSNWSNKNTYDLTELAVFRRAASKINTEYVDPDRVDPEEMLDAALDQVSRRVPEVLCNYDRDSKMVRVVTNGAEHSFRVASLERLPQLQDVLSEVVGFVDRNLADDVERAPIEYAMVRGVLGTLDPHSAVYTPEEYADMRVQNEGQFGGLGISIGIREGQLTILYPMQDTPAWRANLRAGDRIIRIGEVATLNMDIEEAVSMLRGAPDTDVTITIERDGENLEKTLTREIIRLYTAQGSYLGEGVGYVRLKHFSQNTRQEMLDQIDAIKARALEEGYDSLEGLVLDLRDNPGGYLNQAVYVSDYFIGQGVLVVTVGAANTRRNTERAQRFGTQEEMRVVVLVDQGSASASEIVAGAIQNHDRGVVLGVRTFGKGSVQNLYEFEDQSALKLTTGKYLTPGDISIQGVGISPDLEVRRARVTDDRVDLFWQDFGLREEGLRRDDDQPPAWLQQDGEVEPILFLDNDYFEGEPTDHEPNADDYSGDHQVQLARTIIRNSSTPVGSEMLAQSQSQVASFLADTDLELIDALEAQGVDWHPAPDDLQGTPDGLVEIVVGDGESSGVVRPGEETQLTLRVTNRGDAPYHQLRAILTGKRFEEMEFVFGRIEPGETREWTNDLEIPLWFYAPSVDELDVHFFADGDAVPPDFSTTLAVEGVPSPEFAYSYQIIDDGSGDSRGNGDGQIQPGEAIDLLLTVRNTGVGATGSRSERRGEEMVEVPAGFARLKNRSGANLALTRGTLEFALEAGGELRERLHFQVAEDATGESIDLEVTVGDSAFYEFFVDEISLPLLGAPLAPRQRARQMRTRAEVEVRATPEADGLVVATLDGGFESSGSFDGFVQVELPWGGIGWVSEEEARARRGDPGTFNQRMVKSPPSIRLSNNPGGTVVEDSEITITGEVLDDIAIRDIYVFVNEHKVHYERVDSPERHEFELTLQLEDGANEIAVFARDDGKLLSRVTLSLVREDSHAQLAPARGEPEGI